MLSSSSSSLPSNWTVESQEWVHLHPRHHQECNVHQPIYLHLQVSWEEDQWVEWPRHHLHDLFTILWDDFNFFARSWFFSLKNT